MAKSYKSKALPDGSDIFPARDEAEKKYRKSGKFSWVFKLLLCSIIVFCFVADVAVVSLLFKVLVYDKEWGLYATACVALIGFDVLAIFIGMEYARSVYGYKVRKALIIASIIGFLMMFFIIGYVRLTTINETANESTGDNLINREEELLDEPEDSSSKKNQSLAFFYILAPFITSIASGVCSFLLTGDLAEKEIIATEECREALKNVQKEITAELKEAEHIPTLDELLKNDEARYNIAKNEAIAYAKEMADYVKNYLKKLAKDPSAINRLSDDDSSNLVQLMDENKQITLMIDRHGKDYNGVA